MDRETAAALRVSRELVTKWRKKRGPPPNGWRQSPAFGTVREGVVSLTVLCVRRAGAS